MEHLSGLVDFSGKVVLVTGASRGIGRAIALVFARAGAKVALAARSADKLEEVAGEVCALGGEALVLSVDVAVEADAEGKPHTMLLKLITRQTYEAAPDPDGRHIFQYVCLANAGVDLPVCDAVDEIPVGVINHQFTRTRRSLLLLLLRHLRCLRCQRRRRRRCLFVCILILGQERRGGDGDHALRFKETVAETSPHDPDTPRCEALHPIDASTLQSGHGHGTRHRRGHTAEHE